MSTQAGYILNEQIAPRLGAAVPRLVLCVGAEDSEKLIYDGICMAAKMIDRVEQQGKLGKVSSSNIAYYTIQHMKSGRRACGSSAVDIMGTQTQLNGHSELHSLNEVVAETECGDILELHDTLTIANDDPSIIASRKMDWAQVLAGLTEFELGVVQALVDGLSLRQIGRAYQVSLNRLRELQHHLAAKVIEIMGLDALATAMIRP
jgi:hypothetical protein